MSLASAVLSGSVVALGLVRQFLSNPSITYTPVDSNGVVGIPQTVVFQVTGFREKLQNQASKMLLVDVSVGKSFLNDNIAPMPRVWEMEGFLFPLIAVTPIVDQITLEIVKETLRQASDSRQIVQFKPVTTSILSQFSQAFQSLQSQSVTGTVPVVILDIEFTLDPTIINKAPVRITVQRINTLSASYAFSTTLTALPDGQPSNPASSPVSSSFGNTPNTPASAALP